MEVATYTVSEDIGTVEVCAKITKGSTGYSSFVANFTVSSQSALGKCKHVYALVLPSKLITAYYIPLFPGQICSAYRFLIHMVFT